MSTTRDKPCGCPAAELTGSGQELTCGRCGQKWLAQPEAALLAIPPEQTRCAECDREKTPEGHCPKCMGLLGPVFVNEYRTNRRWGGPEEGGWWEDTGEFVRTHAVCPDLAAAQAVERKLEQYLARAREGQHGPGSVLCRGYTDIEFEGHPGRNYPETPSTYE